MKFEWKECSLGDIITLVIDHRGLTPKKLGGDWSNCGYRALSAKNVKMGKLVNEESIRFVGAEMYYKWMPEEVKYGDILITSEAPFGEIIQWNSHEKIVLSQRLFGLRISSKCDANFIYYYMTTGDFQGEMRSRATGTTVIGLRQPELLKCKVRFPDLRSQKRIAEVLASLDDKIETNTAINKNLEEQIKELLSKLLLETKSSIGKLGEYLYIKGRIGWKGLKKSEYLSHSQYRIINGESLTKEGIDWEKAGYISEERYMESPEIMLEIGDILMSKDGTIGKIGYIHSLEMPTSVASGIFVIRNQQPQIISTVFIYFLFQSSLFNKFIAARTEGSVIPHLYQKDFMEFEFPMPSPYEMKHFDEITQPMFTKIVENLEINKRLSELRDTLLPRLMSGEIDVSDIEI